MRIEVDRDVCFGSGECVLAAPDVFELDATGLSQLRADAAAIDVVTAQRIAANCPSGAITVIEEGAPVLAREE